MDMNLVRTFVTVYQQNSFTQAADLLNISQPAVSMSIRRLESELGVTLFVKEGRGIAPTAKAVELAEKMQ
ncbi:LysR family transcriptional regulator [Vibrio astriarenae]|uniref:LysR family transcriptional regulator n=1 Tax=Vibrio astriarenae TaxID=1481923 RepID=UPI003735B05D